MIVRLMPRTLFILLGILLIFCTFLTTFFIKYRSIPEPIDNPDNTQLYHGEFLSWNDVNQIFPKYAQCTIVDFETGQQLNVQRRAGTTHADVQPLQASDTAVLKDIYGQWSWKRRAILVKLEDGRMLAASMNGMPHGAGAIKGNKFNGHFCIHFRDSKTHSSRTVDLAHQLMVWKAAGVFEEQMVSQSAAQTVKIFFTLLDQGDVPLANKLLAGEALSKDKSTWFKYINTGQIQELSSNSYSVNLRLARQDSGSQINQVIKIEMVEGTFWRIKSNSINILFR